MISSVFLVSNSSNYRDTDTEISFLNYTDVKGKPLIRISTPSLTVYRHAGIN